MQLGVVGFAEALGVGSGERGGVVRRQGGAEARSQMLRNGEDLLRERRILAYGNLQSAWPVNSGVFVREGVAYFGAGMISNEGGTMYALDAASGKLIWESK